MRAFDPSWDTVPTEWRDYFLRRTRAALEAAAPHLLKDLRGLVDDMESQPPSEVGTVRGMGGIIRATMKGML